MSHGRGRETSDGGVVISDKRKIISKRGSRTCAREEAERDHRRNSRMGKT